MHQRGSTAATKSRHSLSSSLAAAFGKNAVTTARGGHHGVRSRPTDGHYGCVIKTVLTLWPRGGIQMDISSLDCWRLDVERCVARARMGSCRAARDEAQERDAIL